MEERETLTVMLKGAVNAAKREAQKAWSSWENSHVGPRWQHIIKELWPGWQAARRNIMNLNRELIAAEDPSRGVLPTLHALTAMGLLEESLKLTPLGIMATEINEGHPILMAQTYQQGVVKDLGAEEILAVLVAFAEESGKEMPSIESLDVSQAVTTALQSICRIAAENQRLEGSVRAPRDSYWELNTMWVEPVWRWLQGATIQELCADYDCYEGNLLRLLSKVVNLLEEWRSLATLSNDTEMLEKMRDLELTIMRDFAPGDSLYLRL